MVERIYRWAKPVLAVGLLSAGIVRCPCGGVKAWMIGGLAGTILYMLLARTLPVVRPWPLALRSTWAMLLRAAADEVLWRGWLSTSPGRHEPPYAVVVSVVGFAVTHFPRQGFQGVATHLVTGTAFVAVMLTSGLLGAVAAHGIYNLLVVMARTAVDRKEPRGGRDAE
jgi:membrane protease YdiL (CAAX protease family)